MAYIYARCGKQEEARSILQDLRNRADSEYVDPSLYSVIYLGLGELENAIEGLEQSLAERSPNLAWFKVCPELYMDELADVPRFQAMLREIGYP